jgi:hypothetical protein
MGAGEVVTTLLASVIDFVALATLTSLNVISDILVESWPPEMPDYSLAGLFKSNMSSTGDIMEFI